MGNAIGGSKPKNKTGRKIVAQKLDNAKKTGILSLSEHGLEAVFPQIYELTNLTTLDLSRNSLKSIGAVNKLKVLKLFNVDENRLKAGSLASIQHLTKLQTLSASGNQLGKMTATEGGKQLDPLPDLPASLKQLKLSANALSSIPPTILSSNLPKLQKLDLSSNQLGTVPSAIGRLTQLVELNLDNNVIVNLPEQLGKLVKLKQLSLKNNKMVAFIDGKEQSIPATVFADTPLIDLNLHGNPMTSTQLNHMKGYDAFLERREKVKTSALHGGALTNLDVCGLE
mmetsp:Transcript_1402/g.3889  ORF Transcript_1402/g.3889 Transcript_1402/m.3889 type:complete len:283 (-) Transcript_1402:808-1656(-)|eukprot:CAMPEP_0198116362 /NCGR_PEP_ID=MMETSP1442-20131203/11886_1 /TAXON_ID= /ORGANISM="Craspedostauros australis, Strain CCMP3328" /LENGTH=282 /DNA_ID=CAMNT_0043774157 /DNA_START=77 /DNA_END=925 /DNA_ORIENTATION=+